jgi:hypothetical protein
MQIPMFSFQSRFKSSSHSNAAPGFFQTHAVGEVIRSLFLSSIMWVLLAGTVYTVYTIFAPAHPDEKAAQQFAPPAF